MMLVGIMAAVLWGVGMAMGAPVRARLIMIGILLTGVMIIQVLLPDGHPLRAATGGDPRLWILLFAGLGLAWLYREGLRWLRARARPAPVVTEAARTGTFSETELDRYARHIVLREIGGPGQKALKQAKVLVVGAGGLGAPALQYLAAAGVGTIGVIDHDTVDNSNLARQVIQIGKRSLAQHQPVTKRAGPIRRHFEDHRIAIHPDHLRSTRPKQSPGIAPRPEGAIQPNPFNRSTGLQNGIKKNRDMRRCLRCAGSGGHRLFALPVIEKGPDISALRHRIQQIVHRAFGGVKALGLPDLKGVAHGDEISLALDPDLLAQLRGKHDPPRVVHRRR